MDKYQKVISKKELSNIAFARIRKFFDEGSKRNKFTNAVISKDGRVLIEAKKKVKR